MDKKVVYFILKTMDPLHNSGVSKTFFELEEGKAILP